MKKSLITHKAAAKQIDSAKQECCSGSNSGSPRKCKSTPAAHTQRDFLFKGLLSATSSPVPS